MFAHETPMAESCFSAIFFVDCALAGGNCVRVVAPSHSPTGCMFSRELQSVYIEMYTLQENCVEHRQALEREGEKNGLGLSAAFMRAPGPPYRCTFSGPAQGYITVECRSRFRFQVDR